jgi:hypothetical protein
MRRLSEIFRNNKKVVYTSITGNYDELLTPLFRNEGWDYICFTDSPDLESDFWKIKRIKDVDLSLPKINRIHKILPHKFLPKYDYSLYIDGNIRIIGDIDEYINKFSNNASMLCFIHPQRSCIYYEADACIKMEKDNVELIKNQINRYRDEKYPENNGLIAGGILYRRHKDPMVIKSMDAWWKEVKNNSYRDQLSFNYVCWKTNFQYEICNLNIWKNEFFQHHKHKI